tara:strand:- start:795 stop:1088 length:294 start_codon:yes stop_codon:yes gene_type:complete
MQNTFKIAQIILLLIILVAQQFSINSLSEQIRQAKSLHYAHERDINEVRMMLQTFSDVAPAEMKRIARVAAKEEISRLGLFLEEQNKLDDQESQPND